MTITIHLWMLIPALCVIGAMVLFYLGSRESGFMAGLFPGLGALALLGIAAAFLLGRWLS